MSATRGKVITATLARGKVYVMKHMSEGPNKGKHVTYHARTPVIVTGAEADELEELVYEVPDRDGERFEKPIFRIDHDAETPEVVETRQHVRRRAPASQQEEAPRHPARIPRRPAPR